MDIVILNIINELYADLIIYIDYILHVKRKKSLDILLCTMHKETLFTEVRSTITTSLQESSL